MYSGHLRRCIPTSILLTTKSFRIAQMSFLSSNSNASDGGQTNREHLKVTAEQDRQNDTHAVKVTQIEDLSPTVKKIVVSTDLKPVPFHFKAGQWVDFFIPNVDVVGGFSMTSSPQLLRETGNLELAVKYSTHPPAHWVHTRCQIGSQVSIRVGGNFFLDEEVLAARTSDQYILLIAGGVGINPLCSIVNAIADSGKDVDYQAASKFRLRTTLMFSAKTGPELLFREKFQELAAREPNFKTHFFLTGEGNGINDSASTSAEGRIELERITEVLKNNFELIPQDFKKVQVYMCGPPPMLQDFRKTLASLGIVKLFYEQWWITPET